MSAKRIESSALTDTLPSSRVQSKRLPLARMGAILLACSASSLPGSAFITICVRVRSPWAARRGAEGGGG